jgi:hypothetical protein
MPQLSITTIESETETHTIVETYAIWETTPGNVTASLLIRTELHQH